MKKLLLTVALSATFVTAYGQGRVAFANTSTTLITTNNFQGTALGNTTGPGQYTFGLYLGTLGTPENALVLNITGTNTAGAGRFTGGSPAPLNAPFAGGGTPLTFQIRAWSTFAGASYEQAYAAALLGNLSIYLGKSGIGFVSPTLSPTTQPPLFGTDAGQLATGFLLAPVPEPSSIALGLLGLGAVALFRRRK